MSRLGTRRMAGAVAVFLCVALPVSSASAAGRTVIERSRAAAVCDHSNSLMSTLTRAETRMWASFDAAGVTYPPFDVTFIALKKEARFEVWADSGLGWKFIRSYLVRAASGRLGPKLGQGDRQVPEGVYRIAGLNPQSRYHLSMRLDYPNAFDRGKARADGRARLGGDIMIHGGRASIGCLPVGDDAIEELYALTTRVGTGHVSVIVSPVDLRRATVDAAVASVPVRPLWLAQLYDSIDEALDKFPLPPEVEGVSVAAPRVAVGRAKCKPYDEADCTRRCEKGDVASCARAGLMYRDGRGAASDSGKAWSLLGKACAGGDALGCAELSQLHLFNDGLRRDVGRAAELARAACESGEGHGCTYLANLCFERIVYSPAREACSSDNVQRLREKAVAILLNNCAGWGAYDCNALAEIYSAGDRTTAFRFASGACEGGDPGGCYELAKLIDDSGSTPRAHDLYRRACDAGYSAACER